MSATIKWTTPESIATYLSTGLDGLGAGAGALSDAIDNATGLYTHISLELYLGSAAFTTGYVSLWFIPTIDATNYEDGSATGPIVPSRPPDVIFPMRNATAADRCMAVTVTIPPFSFKMLLQNNNAVAFAANSNTLKGRRYYLQSVTQ